MGPNYSEKLHSRWFCHFWPNLGQTGNPQFGTTVQNQQFFPWLDFFLIFHQAPDWIVIWLGTSKKLSMANFGPKISPKRYKIGPKSKFLGFLFQIMKSHWKISHFYLKHFFLTSLFNLGQFWAQFSPNWKSDVRKKCLR